MYNFLQLILLGKKHCLSFYTDTGNLWEKRQNNCFYARLENLEYFSSALMQPGFQRDLRVSAALPVQVTSYLRYLGVCVCVSEMSEGQLITWGRRVIFSVPFSTNRAC